MWLHKDRPANSWTNKTVKQNYVWGSKQNHKKKGLIDLEFRSLLYISQVIEFLTWLHVRPAKTQGWSVFIVRPRMLWLCFGHATFVQSLELHVKKYEGITISFESDICGVGICVKCFIYIITDVSSRVLQVSKNQVYLLARILSDCCIIHLTNS